MIGSAPQAPVATVTRAVSESEIEAAYWEFDARRKGYNRWNGSPQSERDAFKAVVRRMLNAEKE